MKEIVIFIVGAAAGIFGFLVFLGALDKSGPRLLDNVDKERAAHLND